MQFEKINIDQIKPAEYNPRIMPPEEMEKLKKGINTFGLVDPIIIDLTDHNTVIGGHQRLEALKNINDEQELHLLKMGDIGLVFNELDFKLKDKNDQKALNLSLNKINGERDYSKLDDLLVELSEDNYNLELTGFDELELQEISFENNIDYDYLEGEENLDDIEEDDFQVDETVTCEVKEGDMYQLGNHRILCANSLDETNIEKLIGKDRVDMVYTDPDYDLEEELVGYLSKFCTKHLFIMTSDKIQSQLIKAHFEYFKEFFVVTYNAPIWIGFAMNVPLYNHTLISHWMLEDAKTPDTLKGLSSLIHNASLHDAKQEHKFSKPLKFITPFIKYYTKEGDVVLDIFGGSGSTLIACEEMNRTCLICELNPVYVQNIIDRFEEHTGIKAIKL